MVFMGTFSLQSNSMRTSTVALLMVLPRVIDNHERIILSKIRDSLIRLEIIVSMIVFPETCVRVVENRPSVFIEIQIHIIIWIWHSEFR